MCTCTPHHCGHRGNGSAQPISVTDAPNPAGRELRFGVNVANKGVDRLFNNYSFKFTNING